MTGGEFGLRCRLRRAAPHRANIAAQMVHPVKVRAAPIEIRGEDWRAPSRREEDCMAPVVLIGE